jgi:hypothetical protein
MRWARNVLGPRASPDRKANQLRVARRDGHEALAHARREERDLRSLLLRRDDVHIDVNPVVDLVVVDRRGLTEPRLEPRADALDERVIAFGLGNGHCREASSGVQSRMDPRHEGGGKVDLFMTWSFESYLSAGETGAGEETRAPPTPLAGGTRVLRTSHCSVTAQRRRDDSPRPIPHGRSRCDARSRTSARHAAA